MADSTPLWIKLPKKNKEKCSKPDESANFMMYVKVYAN